MKETNNYKNRETLYREKLGESYKVLLEYFSQFNKHLKLIFTKKELEEYKRFRQETRKTKRFVYLENFKLNGLVHNHSKVLEHHEKENINLVNRDVKIILNLLVQAQDDRLSFMSYNRNNKQKINEIREFFDIWDPKISDLIKELESFEEPLT